MSAEAIRRVGRPTTIKWRELARYKDVVEWEASEENTVVKEDFRQASWVPESVTCIWKCKFDRNKSRIKCKREMKVKFSKLVTEVVLFDNRIKHSHEYDNPRMKGFEDADKDFLKQHPFLFKTARPASCIKEWVEVLEYQNETSFLMSDHRKEIKEQMIRNKARHTPTFYTETFICKFYVKAGFKPCKKRYKVCYSKESANVSVWSNSEEHEHEEIEYTTDVNFKWTKFQTSIIGSYIGNNKFGTAGLNCNKRLANLLKEAGALNDKIPTVDQIGSKKRSMLKKLAEESSIDRNTLGITDESYFDDTMPQNVQLVENLSTVDDYQRMANKSYQKPDIKSKSASIIEEYLEPWACNPCGKEVKTKAVSYCHTCDEHFCEKCALKHSKFKVTNGHKVTALETNTTVSTNTCSSCSENNLVKAATTFCEVCQDYFCVDCTRLHGKFRVTRGHQITQLNPQALNSNIDMQGSPLSSPQTIAPLDRKSAV